MTILKLDYRDLIRLCPAASTAIAKGIISGQKYLGVAELTSSLRLCHFLAQVALESAGMRTTVEYASGQAYEGKVVLGNTQPGDGPRYKGRGLIQTTGRLNYHLTTTEIHKIDPSCPDFEGTPEALAVPPWALLSALTYWQHNRINRYADMDDLTNVTRCVNGGLLGIKERGRYLAIAKSIWLSLDDGVNSYPTLRPGDKGTGVMLLQRDLTAVGYHVLNDGVFGPYTEEALISFQIAHQLIADGVAGAHTWAILSYLNA